MYRLNKLKSNQSLLTRLHINDFLSVLFMEFQKEDFKSHTTENKLLCSRCSAVTALQKWSQTQDRQVTERKPSFNAGVQNIQMQKLKIKRPKQRAATKHE